MVSSEWRMGDGERTIRHSLIATGRNPKRGKSPGDAVDAVADLIDTHFFFLAIFVILGFRPA